MPIKLVAIDLDDTLLDSGLQISPECAQAIQAVRDKGILVTLATGRMHRSALPYAQQLNMDLPLITYQGALVKSAFSSEVIYYKPLPRIPAGEIIDFFKARNLHCHAYSDDELFMEELTPEGRYYEELAGIKAVLVDDLSETVRRNDAMKIMAIIRDQELLLALYQELTSQYHELHITRSKPIFLEAMALKANKGLALQVVAEHYGLQREEVLAIGDSYNDLDMIRWAGVGIAMANARPEVKDTADYITSSNDEHGVAEALRKYVL
ncbi:MAG: Cof-type HAD-IIB family hydrolase [Deltaproteobacteria bacterium]